MTATALEVRVTQDRSRIELTRFTNSLESIVTALREIDRLAAADAKRAAWVIDGLDQTDSVLTVRIAIRLDDNLRRTTESLLLPIEALVSGASSLNHASAIPPYYSEATVERLLRAGKPRRGVGEVSVATVNGSAGTPVDLSGSFRDHAADAVREYESSLGSVAGELHLIATNRRNKQIRLSVYDFTAQRAISGVAPSSMASHLQDLWGSRVLLDGRVIKNRHGQPVRISVNHIERMPGDDQDMPDVDKVLGIAPDWTGGLPVDDYVRSLRRG